MAAREMTEQEYTNYLGQILRDKLSKVHDRDTEEPLHEWKDLHQGFVEQSLTKDNKIPRSEFEKKYSKFYNPANITLYKKSNVSQEFVNWKQDCDEFLRRIDPYMPIFIVADNNPDEIIQVLLPIFRSPNHLTTNDESASAIPDENNKPLPNKEVVAMVSDFFDKYSSSDNTLKQMEARIFMSQCLRKVQDMKTLTMDVRMTDALVREFLRRRDALRSDVNEIEEDISSVNINNDDIPLSAEEVGIVFVD